MSSICIIIGLTPDVCDRFTVARDEVQAKHIYGYIDIDTDIDIYRYI